MWEIWVFRGFEYDVEECCYEAETPRYKLLYLKTKSYSKNYIWNFHKLIKRQAMQSRMGASFNSVPYAGEWSDAGNCRFNFEKIENIISSEYNSVCWW